MKEFFIGLGIGLAIALIVYIWQRISKARAIKKLKKQLGQRMDLESTGLSTLNKELEDLKKQNENLRITNSELSQKPGRAEIHQLQVYQKAVDKLMLSAPGFGPAWQSAISDTESELAKIYTGDEAFVKKVIPGKSED